MKNPVFAAILLLAATVQFLPAQLLENGHLLRAAMLPQSGSIGTGGGEGGRIEEYDWDGKLVALAGPVPQGQYAGLDQVNLGPLPRSLAGRGEVEIALTVAGKAANRVTTRFR